MDLVLLAAGQGTRMKSEDPKILHKIGGKTLIDHILTSLEKLEFHRRIVVVGHKSDEVRRSLSHRELTFVKQKKQLGTAHALLKAREVTNSESILVAPGDAPLVRGNTVKKFIAEFCEGQSDLLLLSVKRDNPRGYGRVVRNEKGKLVRIVEESDLDGADQTIEEVNTGYYALKNCEELWSALKSLDADNRQGEFYLTDLVREYHAQGKNISAIELGTSEELLGINTRRDLARAEGIRNRWKIDRLFDGGVTVINPFTTYVEENVVVKSDTTIYSNTFLESGTRIGSGCEIGPGVSISQTSVGEGTVIGGAEIRDSRIGANCFIGSDVLIRGANVSPDTRVEGDVSSFGDLQIPLNRGAKKWAN